MIAPSLPADPRDRFEVVLDPDADPAHWDQALARFLLVFVRKQSRPTPAPEAEVEFPNDPE